MIVCQRSMAGEDTPRRCPDASRAERGAPAASRGVQPERLAARPWAMKTKLAALLSFALVLSACAPAASTGGDVALARADVPRASTAPADAAAASAALNAFGLDLYRADRGRRTPTSSSRRRASPSPSRWPAPAPAGRPRPRWTP